MNPWLTKEESKAWDRGYAMGLSEKKAKIVKLKRKLYKAHARILFLKDALTRKGIL